MGTEHILLIAILAGLMGGVSFFTGVFVGVLIAIRHYEQISVKTP